MKKRFSIQELKAGVLAGDRAMLSRAITLVESTLSGHRREAEELLTSIQPHTGGSFRLGITGVPGVGKSTFIDVFGLHLVNSGLTVAVLAVDPSSRISGGSILGDKTRMARLSVHENAFIRPSPAGTTAGGVTRNTRETMLLCEAAGFDVVLVETVGVGQSEVAVHSMVDFFLLLMLPGAGDELQGIKRGIMEMADGLVINKSDGENLTKAKLARANYSAALHLMPPSQWGWYPKVLTCSSLEGTGIAEVWEMITEYRATGEKQGFLQKKRETQALNWMEETLRFLIEEEFFKKNGIQPVIERYREKVRSGVLPATVAARAVLDEFWQTKQ